MSTVHCKMLENQAKNHPLCRVDTTISYNTLRTGFPFVLWSQVDDDQLDLPHREVPDVLLSSTGGGRASSTGKARSPQKDKGFLPSSQRSWCVEINRPSPIRRQPRKPATRHALCLGRSRLFAIALPERIILILPPPSQICLQVGDPWMICIRQGKTRSALSVHTRAASLDMVVSVDGLRVCSAYSQSIVTIYSR
uniref:Uncharacterized protein n=1 Tax=Pyricularia oryzae (strain P131) TaxID=1143193 RepID=L7J0H6_PYRO1